MQKNVLKKLFTSHKRDLLLGAALLCAALCLFLVFRLFQNPQGGQVTVKTGDKVYGVYSLSENSTVVIETIFGTNTLIIQDGEAWVVDASCEDKICEGMGPISKVGEMIICLPNELFVTVTSGEEGDVDAIVQ